MYKAWQFDLAIFGSFLELVVPSQNGNALKDLHERYLEEKEGLMSMLKSAQSPVVMTALCEVSRQNLVSSEEEQFLSSALAVGLAERSQDPRYTR